MYFFQMSLDITSSTDGGNEPVCNKENITTWEHSANNEPDSSETPLATEYKVVLVGDGGTGRRRGCDENMSFIFSIRLGLIL